MSSIFQDPWDLTSVKFRPSVDDPRSELVTSTFTMSVAVVPLTTGIPAPWQRVAVYWLGPRCPPTAVGRFDGDPTRCW